MQKIGYVVLTYMRMCAYRVLDTRLDSDSTRSIAYRVLVSALADSCIKAAASLTFLVKFCRLLYKTGISMYVKMSTLKPGLCVI